MTGDCGRRPIEEWEVPWLIQLGARLRGFRTEANLTQAVLGARTGLAERSLRRIEQGHRRTRSSTLQRLAEELTRYTARSGTADEVMVRLLEAAGPALADESEYRSRIEARRRRRVVKQGRRAVTEHTVDYMLLPGGSVLEHHRHRRWVTRRTTRERAYVVLRGGSSD